MASKKSNKNPVNYPFKTKAQFAQELSSSYESRCAAMVQVYELQTAEEQAAGTTTASNGRGFMCSHAVNGTRIAKALIAGEELSATDAVLVDTIAPRYAKQLAALAREAALAADPSLADAAKVFGVGSKG
jgi:hypothetical protein